MKFTRSRRHWEQKLKEVKQRLDATPKDHPEYKAIRKAHADLCRRVTRARRLETDERLRTLRVIGRGSDQGRGV